MNEKLSKLFDELEVKEKEVVRLKENILKEIKNDTRDQVDNFFSKVLIDDSSELMRELEKAYNRFTSRLNTIPDNMDIYDNYRDPEYLRSIKEGLVYVKRCWKDYIQNKDINKILYQLKKFNNTESKCKGFEPGYLKSLADNPEQFGRKSKAMKCCSANDLDDLTI